MLATMATMSATVLETGRRCGNRCDDVGADVGNLGGDVADHVGVRSDDAATNAMIDNVGDDVGGSCWRLPVAALRPNKYGWGDVVIGAFVLFGGLGVVGEGGGWAGWPRQIWFSVCLETIGLSLFEVVPIICARSRCKFDWSRLVSWIAARFIIQVLLKSLVSSVLLLPVAMAAGRLTTRIAAGAVTACFVYYLNWVRHRVRSNDKFRLSCDRARLSDNSCLLVARLLC